MPRARDTVTTKTSGGRALPILASPRDASAAAALPLPALASGRVLSPPAAAEPDQAATEDKYKF